jgi:hypothetical protein
MAAIRVVQAAGSERVSVIDQATGFEELVEMSAEKERAEVDAVVEEEPDVSGRYHYGASVDTVIEDEPDVSGRYHYAP